MLKRFTKSQIVVIESHTELTQRRSSVWSQQKRAPKLVIAKRRKELLYPCSDVAPNFGHPHFYYSVPVQNCLYDCEYCYLQGMYTSAHLVYFANQQDMIHSVIKKTLEHGELYLCIAYDNDILAMEALLGVVSDWVEGLRSSPETTVEVRTKSANFHQLKNLEPPENFILAWTLTPQSLIDRFEAKTPSLEGRVKSMKQAMNAGWRVRLCFDPLLSTPGSKEHYQQLFHYLDEQELWGGIEDSSYGLFRMNKTFLRQARRARPDSALLMSETVHSSKRDLYVLKDETQQGLLEFVGQELRKRLTDDQVWLT